jgi:competence protein ComEC
LLSAGTVTGVAAAHAFNSLPPLWLVAVCAAIGLTASFRPRGRILAFTVLACCWCLWHFHLRLDDRLDPTLAGQPATLRGTVASIPSIRDRYLTFRFRPDPEYRGQGVPSLLLLRWYREWPDLRVNQRWRFDLKLQPPWGRVNFQGADTERWLFGQGIGGLGTVRGGGLLAERKTAFPEQNAVRELLRHKIAAQVEDRRQRGVVQALAIADRSGLTSADQALLKVTGTTHLLAISGLHVGLAAAGGYWLARLPLLMLPAGRIGAVPFTVSIGGSLSSAAAYAALAGFGIPTLRAVLMLSVALMALSLPRRIHPLQGWLTALVAVLLLDPFSPLGAGFWFSFLAVAALLILLHPRPGRRGWFRSLLLAQAGVTVVLLPLGLAWYQFFTPVSFLANLVAIPWVSVLVVPPVLLGIPVSVLCEPLAGYLWSMAGLFSALLFEYLECLAAVQGNLDTLSPPPLWQSVLAVAGGLLLLLPRGLGWRWYGLFMILPLFLPPAERSRPGEIELEVLDAGQGTAALLSSGRHLMIYDAGPGDGRGHDLVDGVIAPAVARLSSRAPGRIVISHGDLDHAGGLESVLQLYPQSSFLASLPALPPGIEPCRAAMEWAWPGASFQTLHPSRGLPYLGNDSSCVVSMRSEPGSILFAGDISEAIEARLLRQGLPPHRVLLVPHHGSATSSSTAFIERVGPEIAIATASLGNRFDFPRDEVRARYESRNIRFWSTGECGAIRLRLQADGAIQASSARRERRRIWRYPAAPNCP